MVGIYTFRDPSSLFAVFSVYTHTTHVDNTQYGEEPVPRITERGLFNTLSLVLSLPLQWPQASGEAMNQPPSMAVFIARETCLMAHAAQSKPHKVAKPVFQVMNHTMDLFPLHFPLHPIPTHTPAPSVNWAPPKRFLKPQCVSTYILCVCVCTYYVYVCVFSIF